MEGGKASNRPDPSKFVPMEIFRSTVAELNVRNQGMTEELALNHVEEQMSKGRLLPFLKDWAVDLCKRDRPAFDSFIGETGTSMNKLFSPLGLERRPPSGRQAKLSETEAQIARTLGHSEEEFIAANRSRSS